MATTTLTCQQVIVLLDEVCCDQDLTLTSLTAKLKIINPTKVKGARQGAVHDPTTEATLFGANGYVQEWVLGGEDDCNGDPAIITCPLPPNFDSTDTTGTNPLNTYLSPGGTVYELTITANGESVCYRFQIDAATDYTPNLLCGAIPIRLIDTANIGTATVPVISQGASLADVDAALSITSTGGTIVPTKTSSLTWNVEAVGGGGGVQGVHTFPSLKTFAGAPAAEINAAFVAGSFAIGDAIQTGSYYTGSQYGGATYIVQPPGTGVDDGGSFIDFTGFQLQAVFDGERSVMQFGARGDGAADDEPAITAMYASALNGTTVIFPGGFAYRLNSTVLLQNRADIKTVGSGRPILVMGFTSATGQAMIRVEDSPGMTFDGVDFQGIENNTAYDAIYASLGSEFDDYSCLTMIRCDDAVVSNLHMENRINGVSLITCDNGTIENVTGTGFGAAIETGANSSNHHAHIRVHQGSMVTAINTQSSDFGSGFISGQSDPTGATGATVPTELVVENIRVDVPRDVGIYLSSADRSQVVNPRIIDGDSAGVRSHGDNNAIIGGLIRNCQIGIGIMGRTTGVTHSCSVTGTTIDAPTSAGIEFGDIGGAGFFTDNAVVTGVTISNSLDKGINGTCERTVISDTTIRDSAGSAVVLAGAGSFPNPAHVVLDNVMVDTGGNTAFQLTGLRQALMTGCRSIDATHPTNFRHVALIDVDSSDFTNYYANTGEFFEFTDCDDNLFENVRTPDTRYDGTNHRSTHTLPGVNLVLTPSFETDTNSDGLADDWLDSTTNGVLTIETTDPFSGSSFQRLTCGTAANPRFRQVVNAVIGTEYTVSAWMRAQPGMNAEMRVGDPAGGTASVDYGQVPITEDNTWQHVSVTFVATTATVQIGFISLGAVIGGLLDADAVVMAATASIAASDQGGLPGLVALRDSAGNTHYLSVSPTGKLLVNGGETP